MERWHFVVAALFVGALAVAVMNHNEHQAGSPPASSSSTTNSTTNYHETKERLVWTKKPPQNSAEVHKGQSWLSSRSNGRLITTSKGLILRLDPTEKFVDAQLGYGYRHSPTYKRFPWSGEGVATKSRVLLEVNGTKGVPRKVPLTEVKVLVCVAGCSGQG